MNKKRIEVKTYKEYALCECGGLFKERATDAILDSYPAQTTFKCNKCGEFATLYEQDWPKTIYEFKEE